jgi:hypothetical protein
MYRSSISVIVHIEAVRFLFQCTLVLRSLQSYGLTTKPYGPVFDEAMLSHHTTTSVPTKADFELSAKLCPFYSLAIS